MKVKGKNALGYSRIVPSEDVPTDLEISRSLVDDLGLLPMDQLANAAGIDKYEWVRWGENRAKVKLSTVDRLKDSPEGNYVIVTGTCPIPLGEGKTTTVIGLSQALGVTLGKKSIASLRQPSLGPMFGVKGGAAGGGYSQVVPMEEMNLGSGDIHAVTVAHNLVAAAIDARMFHEDSQTDEQLWSRLCPDSKDDFTPVMKRRLKKLGIDCNKKPTDLTTDERSAFVRLDFDKESVTWHRVLDQSDRHLRKIEIGLGANEVIQPKGTTPGVDPKVQHSRITGFDVTAASEIMSILALTTSMADLRERLGSIVCGYSKAGTPITADDLGVGGALAVLLRDALMPTLMQTVERTPALIHTGAFSYVGYGNSSIIADDVALRLVGEDGYVVTTSGSGTDLGLEKFFNIKVRYSGAVPRCVVLVANITALKVQGGANTVIKPGKPLPEEYQKEDVELVKKGCAHLVKHIQNAQKYHVNVVVAVNKFKYNTQAEIDIVLQASKDAGVFDAVVSNHWAQGGYGAEDLARSVEKACLDQNTKHEHFQFLYDLNLSITKKAEIVAKEMYGADGVDFTDLALKQMKKYEDAGFGNLPICIAKTHFSFTCDPSIKGTPTGFRITVREVRCCVGAGYIYLLCGDIMTIQGLPTRPNFYDLELDVDTGAIIGLF